jgi:hypothetical protein
VDGFPKTILQMSEAALGPICDKKPFLVADSPEGG